VVLGASLNSFTTQGGDLFRAAHVIRIDRAAAPPDATIAVDEVVHADAREVAEALLAALPAAEHPRTAALKARLSEWTPESEIVDQSAGNGLDGELLAARLERLLPGDRTVIVDGGRYCGYACRTFSVRRSRDFSFTVFFGSMGLGMATAVGAAVAERNPITVLVVGDGGFMMALPELETAVRHGLPLVVLALNDGGFGSEMYILGRHGLPPDVARMPTPSLAELAQGMGADGVTLRSWEDLDGLAGRFEDLRGPLVVDCRIDPDINPISEYLDKLHEEGQAVGARS
jgi:acetolactate synthase I/II/III large subunit